MSESKVSVDGEDAILHITDQSVMFEKGGRVSGFDRSAIRMVKPDGDAVIIAYASGNDVKSVRVEPITAVASLLMPGGRSSSQNLASTASLDEVFERLYTGARRELEERLTKVQEEPEDKSLRLTQDERTKYFHVWEQMTDLVGAMYGFDPWADGNSLCFLGLEMETHERQLDTVKTLHIFFLIDLVSLKAETADISYSTEDVWPEDWERILVKFQLTDGPFLTDKFHNYLKSKWVRRREGKTPLLARS